MVAVETQDERVKFTAQLLQSFSRIGVGSGEILASTCPKVFGSLRFFAFCGSVMLFGACIFNGCGESCGLRLRISVAEEVLQLFFLPMYFFANSITTFATSSDMTFFFRHALANVFYFFTENCF